MTTEPLLAAARERLLAALALLQASIEDYPGYDPARAYSPKEREPLDALCDRYMRAFETSLRFFKTWERLRHAAPSDTFRDLLFRVHRPGWISDPALWLRLRDARNRVAHEYQPAELHKLYEFIVHTAGPEFSRLAAAISRLE